MGRSGGNRDEGAFARMRVVAGKARRTRLECPSGCEVRPTPDMCREALFNILRGRVEDAVFLDLFAGAGTMGIEALSRGAAWCVFVERSPTTRQALERNLARTRLAEFCDVMQRDVFRCLDALAKLGRKFDITFVGPPFSILRDARRRSALLDVLDRLDEGGLSKGDGVVIMQHEKKTEMPEATARLVRCDQRLYGRNAFTFYRSGIRSSEARE